MRAGGVEFRDRDVARDSFIRAAAALTEWPVGMAGQSSSAIVAFALLEAAIGLIHVVKLDPGRVGLDLLITALRSATSDDVSDAAKGDAP